MKNTPSDAKLYASVKKQVFQKNQVNSAYRSGLLVKTYKNKYYEKYGNIGTPYKTTPNLNKKEEPQGLVRWFMEKWTNQDNQTGYTKVGDIYRPTKRITKKTPKTFKELTKDDIKKATIQKLKTGRVNKF